MMSYGKQLEVYNSQGRIAPEPFIERIIKFEKLVFETRKEQKAFLNCKNPELKEQHLKRSKELEKELDSLLTSIGYTDTPDFF